MLAWGGGGGGGRGREREGQQTDLILLDFSKTFDISSREKLLFKLHQYDIRWQVL